MARKSKRFGAVRLKNRMAKRNAMLFNHSTATKKVGITVYVQRTDISKWEEPQGRRSAYVAWACPARDSRHGVNLPRDSRRFSRGFTRCGPQATAKTPTAAVKKALHNLAGKKTLR